MGYFSTDKIMCFNNKHLNLLQEPDLVFWANKLGVKTDSLHDALLNTGCTDLEILKAHISNKTFH